jgi:hypothetical protein
MVLGVDLKSFFKVRVEYDANSTFMGFVITSIGGRYDRFDYTNVSGDGRPLTAAQPLIGTFSTHKTQATAKWIIGGLSH